MEESVPHEINLFRQLGRAHRVLALIAARPRAEPLRLTLGEVKKLWPAEIVNLCLVLEVAERMGFPSIHLEPPPPGRLGALLWLLGLWDQFPQYAPSPPANPLHLGAHDRCIELTRFTDTAGAWTLGKRLPEVLLAAPGAPDVPGGRQTLKRLANAVFELAENAAVHSRRLTPEAGVVGYYMVQRLPNSHKTFIAVGDVGDGIPATMRASHDHLEDDLAAVWHALERGVTGDDGGGNGLAVARETAFQLPGGVMTIESGGAFVRLRRNGNNVTEQQAGAEGLTRISFKIDV